MRALLTIVPALSFIGCAHDEVVPDEDGIPLNVGVEIPQYHTGTFTGELHYTYHHHWQGSSYTVDTTFQTIVQVWAGSEFEASPPERWVNFDDTAPYRPWTGDQRMRWDEEHSWYGHALEHMTFSGAREDSIQVFQDVPGTTTQVHYHFRGVRQQ
jgi:hypothetical protein